MLIEFSVANFRSIRERQKLSMVAAVKDYSLPDNVIHVSLPGLSKTKLLKSVVLYGANASGKSNVLKALRYMRWFVENSATSIKPDGITKTEAFRLDLESRNKPSEFEVSFVQDDIRYQFGFTLDSTKVHEEWLYAYPKGRPQRWYQRKLNADTGEFEWDFSEKHFRGERDSISRQTRSNALFLSTAAQLNHDRLGKIQKWFLSGLYYLQPGNDDSDFGYQATSTMMLLSENIRKGVSRFVRDADLGISEVQAVQSEVKMPELLSVPDANLEKIRAVSKAIGEALGVTTMAETVWLHHVTGSTELEKFERDQESAGTVRYFSMLGPWWGGLGGGAALLIDELGANIHPLLVRGLLRTLHSSARGSTGGQVVFTTHDVTLLDKQIFRRDQIWLTEKDQEGATRLYPLTDYQPRKDESLAKGYLAGRYGAIPFLSGELAL